VYGLRPSVCLRHRRLAINIQLQWLATVNPIFCKREWLDLFALKELPGYIGSEKIKFIYKLLEVQTS
jgi:hypothetical protein